jgi:hypothetical protein
MSTDHFDFYIVVMSIIVAHFLCDFVMQSDTMAVNKSKSWYWLSIHVLTYSAGISLLLLPLFGMSITMLIWFSSNFILHFVTDAVTSRITSYLWKKNERHWFFVTIGADQVVHYACLFGLLMILI